MLMNIPWCSYLLIDESQYRGIDETRRKTVPAYCFDNFSKLPTEIQFSIWSFASRFGRPQRHKILPMCCDGIYGCDCYDVGTSSLLWHIFADPDSESCQRFIFLCSCHILRHR